MSKANTLFNIGKLYSEEIEEGQIGAYQVDDPNYHYYLVKWIGKPYQAPRTEKIAIGTDKFPVVKGDWLCQGLWLEKLPDARSWWTMTDRECVVQLEKVINANTIMRILSHDNPLRRGLDKK